MTEQEQREQYLAKYGQGYNRINNSKHRHLYVKGSRASKKSRNISSRWIDLMYDYPQAHLLVVRRFAILNRDSTFATLKWAIKRLPKEAQADWKFTLNPLEIQRISTGQKILFRGCDDPESIGSITVDEGYLCWCWIEEAYQLDSEDMFKMVDDMIRGVVPQGYFKQTVLSFNPWNEKHWLRKFFGKLPADQLVETNGTRYIDGKQIETTNRLALTVNYLCNEWLDDADKQRFAEMRVNEPARYRVAGLGDWGVVAGAIYTNWSIEHFNWHELYYKKNDREKPVYDHRIGLDFGFTANLGVVGLLVDEVAKEIYVYKEIYKARLTNAEIVKAVTEKGWRDLPIHADSEDPRTINELKQMGLPRIFGVKKASQSVTSGIQHIRGYKIIIHPTCENFIIEINNYQFAENKLGKELPQPKKEWDHLMDAMRYAMCDDKGGSTTVVGAETRREITNERQKILNYQARMARQRPIGRG